jgi:hypothetical protein
MVSIAKIRESPFVDRSLDYVQSIVASKFPDTINNGMGVSSPVGLSIKDKVYFRIRMGVRINS